ncbi:MAG: hypothetical protein NPIRA03_39180 [Nitrospirales bacterium]|nr:MAG: hypothetical protein NPIRA03_39180 [Nitrospirales bacterium]
MSIPRITIVLIFLFGMLTGCETPLIDIHVDVRNGVQPGGGDPNGPAGACPPGWPPHLAYMCSGGGTPPNTGVLEKIHGTGAGKVYEVKVEVEGQIRKLYFSVPPDDVQDDLEQNDEVVFSFDDAGTRKLRKAP